MATAIRRSNTWGSLTKPREAMEAGREGEPPPSARNQETGAELWMEEAIGNGFDPALLFTRSDSKKDLQKDSAVPSPGPLTRTRSRDKLVGNADSAGMPLSKKWSGLSGNSAVPSPGGGRLTRSGSEIARIASLGSFDFGNILETGGGEDVLRQSAPSVGMRRTRSQDRLDQACRDLGVGDFGGAITRLNSRGGAGVAAANQELTKGRNKELSLDLFGLDGISSGPSSGPMTATGSRRMALGVGIVPSPVSARPSKRMKSGDGAGPSPRDVSPRTPGRRGQERAAQAAAEVSQTTPTGEDPWVKKSVRLKRGKYEGRVAFVLGKTTKKYQVQVEGVPYQLEFYSTMFCLPEHYKPPKGRKKKKVDDGTDSLGMFLTPSLDDIPPGVDLNLMGPPVVRTRSQEKMMAAGM